MLLFIINALKIIFLLGFLIFIHEGGHFLIAKLCKVKVNEFAIGFGPTIWKKQGKETKYALRLIPLGGFVNMEGEEQRSSKEGSFSEASIPKRIAIVLAGGIVNIIFGIIIYFALATTNDYVSMNVKETIANYAASNYGIQNGDKIISINNKKVRLKSDVEKLLGNYNNEELKVKVKRNNEFKDIILKPTKIDSKTTGIYFKSNAKEEEKTKVVALEPNSIAQNQGIQVNDIIIMINDIDIQNNPYKISEVIEQSKEDEIKITLLRKGEKIEVKLIPQIISTYYLGVVFEQADNSIYYAFWDTIDFGVSIIDNIKQLFTGKVSANQLMGPVGISEVVADTSGIKDYIYIFALISLSLGVTNLLPFPPLDGGKIVILIIEAIRKKPMKENVEIGIQMAGFVILIGLAIFVTYNDVLRIF